MAFAFEDTIQQWRARIQSGPVGQYLSWWLGELRDMLPEQWQQKLQHALRRVTIRLENDELHLGVEENLVIEELQTFPVDSDASLQGQQVGDLLTGHELNEVPRYFLLDGATVLQKELLLPEATEANLKQVLTFEMDRQTPFKASDVYFDWLIAGRNKETSQIRVWLFVVPRQALDASIDVLAARGLAPSGVDIIEQGRSLGMNLLPPQQRVRIVNRKARLNYALGGVAALLLVLVMAQSLFLRSHQVTELEAAIDAVRDEARLVQGIKNRIADTSAAAGFLGQRRASMPLSVAVLADVTELLPDDTYLDRLVITEGTVQLQGKSQNAQRLIELVNDSELMQDASFRGSTRLDSRTGLEVFEVNANIVQAMASADTEAEG